MINRLRLRACTVALPIIVTSMCCAAGSVFAQTDLEGTLIGLHGGATLWSVDDVNEFAFSSEFAPHGGAQIGFGLSDFFMLFGRLDVGRVSPDNAEAYTLTFLDVGGRFYPSQLSSSVRPYLELSFTAAFADVAFPAADVNIAGPGGSGGVGVLKFFTEQLAIQVGVSASLFSLQEVLIGGARIDETVGAQSTRLLTGVVWKLSN